jgi:hypothetical protein
MVGIICPSPVGIGFPSPVVTFLISSVFGIRCRIFHPQASTLNFSTPDFFNHDFFYHELFSNEVLTMNFLTEKSKVEAWS